MLSYWMCAKHQSTATYVESNEGLKEKKAITYWVKDSDLNRRSLQTQGTFGHFGIDISSSVLASPL